MTHSESSTSHTPGPWRVDNGPATDTWQAWSVNEPTWIADVWTSQADAQLIAAAPRLYEFVFMLATQSDDDGLANEAVSVLQETGLQAVAIAQFKAMSRET